MKFYNRDQELAILSKIEEPSMEFAQMTFVVGRRRIWKTNLLLEAYKKLNCLYFFVAKKNEALLCIEFVEEVKQKLQVPIYKYRSALEAGNLDYLNEIIARDYNTYSGKILEKYFIEKLKMEKKYNTIGTYWERGNENEIDIVAVNDIEKVIFFRG